MSEDSTLRQISARAHLHLRKVCIEQKVCAEKVEELDRKGREMLKKELAGLPEWLASAEDEMVVLDGLQTEIARYTGREFLPHMQRWVSRREKQK